MSSQASLTANKRNALRSTGPLTASGKRRVSRNALKHGLSTSMATARLTRQRSRPWRWRLLVPSGAAPIAKAARGVAEAQFELRRQREFRLALVEVEEGPYPRRKYR